MLSLAHRKRMHARTHTPRLLKRLVGSQITPLPRIQGVTNFSTTQSPPPLTRITKLTHPAARPRFPRCPSLRLVRSLSCLGNPHFDFQNSCTGSEPTGGKGEKERKRLSRGWFHMAEGESRVLTSRGPSSRAAHSSPRPTRAQPPRGGTRSSV